MSWPIIWPIIWPILSVPTFGFNRGMVGRVGVEPTTKRLRGSFAPVQLDGDELKTLYILALTESGVRLASVRSAPSGSSLVADGRRLKAPAYNNEAP